MRPVVLLSLLAACNDGPPADPCLGLDADGDGTCDGDAVDWSRDARIPSGEDRANIYGLADDDLARVRDEGLLHASVWPIEISGLLLPYQPLARMLADDASTPEQQTMAQLARTSLGFGTMSEMYAWLGLAPYPPEDATGPYRSPYPQGFGPGDPMGAGVIATEWGDALTFSCATCHTASFFGKTVVGMTNRRTRANEFFHLATLFFPGIPSDLFVNLTGADELERALFERTQQNLPAVGAKVPETRGLDTALAQVALSLSRREEDGWATRSPALEAAPRDDTLATFVADSKPAVWWTLKHKTRWLSDGSVVSGNPIFTNFLWNELGRATDLRELDGWLTERRLEVDQLTVAVFATEAPRWADFFGADSVDLAAAKRGQALFDQHCATCHGTYDKGWDAPDASSRTGDRLLATTRVRYHEQTPVMEVGTDPQRAQGMSYFADALNDLAISQRNGTVVEVQQGYVPPPLDGIWARYPYLHNASVPTLCALLSPAEERPAEFWMGPTDDPATDFDADCVGYPVGDAVPAAWKADARARFDTSLPGLRAVGHDAFLLDSRGEPVLSAAARADLIAFLKTL